MADLYKPGTDDVAPGEYVECDENGEEVSDPRIVTIEKGDRLPPTQESGHMWKKK